jgi:hypothetical protein
MIRILSMLLLTACAVADRPGAAQSDADRPSTDAPLTAIDAPPPDGAAPPIDTPAAPTTITLTQVSTNVLATSTLACGAGTTTAKQAYYRVFDLPAFGITTPLTISSVAFGVQSASGTETVTVNVGTYSPAPSTTLDVGGGSADWGAGDVTAIATAPTSVTGAATGTVVSVPIAAVIPGGSNLIIEVQSPNDTGSTSFFLGASVGTETSPGFFWSPTCSATPPGTPTELGEGVVPFLISATGTY